MKTFIFDLYGTLVDIRTDENRDSTWQAVAGFFAERGAESRPDSLRARYEALWEEEIKQLKKVSKSSYPEGDIVRVFRAMAAELGAQWSDETCEEAARCMRRASMVHIKLFDGVLALFAQLRSLGAKLYLLSNAQAVFTRDEIEECGLDNRMDGILLSSECGVRKPDGAFYKKLFEVYGLDKSDCIMIGDDKETDGKGARAAGIKFFHTPGGAPAFTQKLVKLAQGK